ncbi:hypothetical protein GCM10027592_29690 [Spirosoma flavus]
MQKVITIMGHGPTTHELETRKGRGIETVYPELQKLLDEEYKIVNTIPAISSGDNFFVSFAITFVLEK